MNNAFDQLNDLLSSININDIDAESNELREELPDGYYLSELISAEFKESKSSHQPMIAMKFQTVEDGLTLNDEGNDLVNLDNTARKYIYVYYVLKDEKTLKRFISDMLKFEDRNGNSMLSKDYFAESTLFMDALDVITGSRIYIQSSTSDYNGQKSSWKNLVSWKRASMLELPID